MICRAVLAAAVAALACRAAGAQVVPACSVAPGYSQHGPARTFDTDTLFEYMDGNSEGYFAYGFVNMKGVTCRKGDDTLVLDISEMADPEMAFGMFSANKDPKMPVEKIGAAGQIAPRKAVFVKGKYYVEAAAEPEKDHSAVLRVVAAALEKLTPGETTAPAALAWFPTAGLDSTTGPRLVPQSVLGIRALAKGYVAQYAVAKAFVVQEESPEKAKSTLEKLHSRFGDLAKATVGDESWKGADRYLGNLCVFRKGRFVAGAVNGTEGQDACSLAGSLAGRLP